MISDQINAIKSLLGAPAARKNLLATGAGLVFACLLFAYHNLLPRLSGQLQHPEFVAISLLILISVVMMVLWLTLGVFGGLGAFLFALISLYRPLTALNPYYYSVLIMTFFLSGTVGYYYHRKISLADQQHVLALERTAEDTNLINNHLKRRKSEVSAMGNKIVSLLKLKNIADSLSLSLSDKEVMRIVSEESLMLFEGRTRVMLFLYDPKRKKFFLSHTCKKEDRKDFPRSTGGTFGTWVQKNMKSLIVKDIHRDFRFSLEEEELSDDAISVMIKPLVVDNRLLGLLRVDSDVEDEFEQYELRLLDIIGGLASVALENAMLYRQTENLAVKDSLTGLYVHRYFMERLEEEIKRALHVEGRFAFLMIDIDEFKRFNDEHGHITGDAMLKKVAQILKQKVSPGDFVARYGGEEFSFISLNSDHEEAMALAEEIRHEIACSLIEVRRIEHGVTVSIGVSTFPDDSRVMTELIGVADKRLYKAKREGKNRVCSS